MHVTHAAVNVIELVRGEHGIPDEFGVPLVPAGTRPEERTVAIDFAASPSEGDEVSRQHGTLVFVAGDVAADLRGAELDVIRFESDDGPSLRLVLRPGHGRQRST